MAVSWRCNSVALPVCCACVCDACIAPPTGIHHHAICHTAAARFFLWLLLCRQPKNFISPAFVNPAINTALALIGSVYLPKGERICTPAGWSSMHTEVAHLLAQTLPRGCLNSVLRPDCPNPDAQVQAWMMQAAWAPMKRTGPYLPPCAITPTPSIFGGEHPAVGKWLCR